MRRPLAWLVCAVAGSPLAAFAQPVAAPAPSSSPSSSISSEPLPSPLTAKRPLSPTDLKHKRTGDYVTGFPLFAEDPNTGYGAGAAAFYYDNGPASEPLFAYTPYKLRVYTLAFVTTKGQFYTTVDLDVPYVAASNYRLRAYATFDRNISTNYYGTGQSTLDPLHFSGAPGQSYPWAPRYDDALRARQPAGTTTRATTTTSSRVPQRTSRSSAISSAASCVRSSA